MSLRIRLTVLLLTAIACLPAITKADTFDFTFSSTNGSFSGSGSFDTYAYATAPNGQPIAYSGFYISSLDGEVNGISMVLLPGSPGSSMDYYGPIPPVPGVPLTLFDEYNFLNGSLDFSLDGQDYFIHDVDMWPSDDLGLNLFGPGFNDLITMTVTPAADPVPEPSTLLSLLLGLLVITGLLLKLRTARAYARTAG